MPITREQLVGLEAPFEVIADNDGRRATVTGFSENDPLGVGGGMLPDMPCAYYEGGGWNLVEDMMQHFSLPADQSS